MTALRGVMTTAMENAATEIPTVGEMAAVFEEEEMGNVDVEENDDNVGIDYEGESDNDETARGGDGQDEVNG